MRQLLLLTLFISAVASSQVLSVDAQKTKGAVASSAGLAPNAAADNFSGTTMRYVDSVGMVIQSTGGVIRHIEVYDADGDGNITRELQSAIRLAPAYTAIDVVGGEYSLDTSLTLPTVIPGSHGFITIRGNGTILKVRNGYTGCFIEQTIAVRRVTVEGFNVCEDVSADTAKRLWTGIRLVANTKKDGHQWNLFRNLYFEDPGIGIDLRVDAPTSWINANQFEDIRIVRPTIMVRSRLPLGSNNWYLIDGNTFTRIEGQAGKNTITAVDSMEGIYNSFYECTIYDLEYWNPTAKAMAIGTKSANTLIWRGRLDYPKYIDHGVRTTIASGYAGSDGLTIPGKNQETWNRIRVNNLYTTRKLTFGYDSIATRPNPDGFVDEGQIFADSTAGMVIVGQRGKRSDLTIVNNKDSRDTVLSLAHGLKNIYMHSPIRLTSNAGGPNPAIWFDSSRAGKFHITYTLSTNKLTISDSSGARMQFDQGGSVAWMANHYFIPDSSFSIGFDGTHRPKSIFAAYEVKAKVLTATTSATLAGDRIATQRYADTVAVNEQRFRRAGRWVSNSVSAAANTTQVSSDGRMNAYPFLVAETFTTDSILTEVTTGARGAMTVAIYNDSSAASPTAPPYPMHRLWVGGRDSANAGVKAHSLKKAPLTLNRGQLYWAVVHSNTPVTFRAVPLAAIPAVLGSDPAMGSNSQYTSSYVSRAYDQFLPSTFAGGSIGYTATSSAPLLLMRVKSIP